METIWKMFFSNKGVLFFGSWILGTRIFYPFTLNLPSYPSIQERALREPTNSKKSGGTFGEEGYIYQEMTRWPGSALEGSPTN